MTAVRQIGHMSGEAIEREMDASEAKIGVVMEAKVVRVGGSGKFQ